MTNNRDSQKLWLSIRSNLSDNKFTLGQATSQAYLNDPRMITFMASRYKFVSKMLERVDTALEVGCGDAFGAVIASQTVKKLICTDIDIETIKDNTTRCREFSKIEFIYHDFRSAPFPKKVNAIFLVDVIEHIYPEEEKDFVKNITDSLSEHGFLLMGTPNKTAEQYASEHSRAGHVNLKTHNELRDLLNSSFHNVFMFSMNDETIHTGYGPMAHYLWAMGTNLRTR